MQHKKYWVLALLIIAALPLSACGESSTAAEEESGPAAVEQIKGTDLVRVTLTPQAAKRLGIETGRIKDTAGRRKVIPYSAVLYGTDGETFTYANPEGLTFVRRDIKVDHIDGGQAVLADGPASGTAVATVGAAELLGAETDEGDGGH